MQAGLRAGTSDELSRLLTATFAPALNRLTVQVTVASEPVEAAPWYEFDVDADGWHIPVGGAPGRLTLGQIAEHIVDQVQQELSQGPLWGRPVPPCAAHPRHPANAEAAGDDGLRLRCSVDPSAWYQDIAARP